MEEFRVDLRPVLNKVTHWPFWRSHQFWGRNLLRSPRNKEQVGHFVDHLLPRGTLRLLFTSTEVLCWLGGYPYCFWSFTEILIMRILRDLKLQGSHLWSRGWVPKLIQCFGITTFFLWIDLSSSQEKKKREIDISKLKKKKIIITNK